MKNLGCLLALWLASTGAVWAQGVEVEVTVDDAQFLAGEPVPVSVRISNRSGQTLGFGQEKWLNYAVEARDGLSVSKSGDPPTDHDFDLETAKVATQHSDLAPYFDFSRPGKYTVTAAVTLGEWGREVLSPAKSFDIVRGFKIWETEFGVPQPETNHAPPEVRKYILQQVTSSRRMKIYLRVTDGAEMKSLHLQPVGQMVSFSRPQTQLDAQNNLHLLFEESARTFNYSVFTPEGELITRQTFAYADDGPHLKMDPSGKVSVSGGFRHVVTSDVPRSKDASHTNDPPPRL